jgi:hypothetical protein
MPVPVIKEQFTADAARTATHQCGMPKTVPTRRDGTVALPWRPVGAVVREKFLISKKYVTYIIDQPKKIDRLIEQVVNGRMCKRHIQEFK